MVPQFDFLTLGPQIFSLLIVLFFLYYFLVKYAALTFIQIKKFRVKKLLKSRRLKKNIKKELNYSSWVTNYFYKNNLSKRLVQ